MLKKVQHDDGAPPAALPLRKRQLSVAEGSEADGIPRFRFETELLRDCHEGRKPAEKCGFRLAGEDPFQ
jgi:hypothetical protein